MTGFVSTCPKWLHLALHLEGPSHCLMLCYCRLEILFKQGSPHFHFALRPANYVANPSPGLQNMAPTEALGNAGNVLTRAFSLRQQREGSVCHLQKTVALCSISTLLCSPFWVLWFLILPTVILVLAWLLHLVWAIAVSKFPRASLAV